jgi:hypothetical protein
MAATLRILSYMAGKEMSVAASTVPEINPVSSVGKNPFGTVM